MGNDLMTEHSGDNTNVIVTWYVQNKESDRSKTMFIQKVLVDSGQTKIMTKFIITNK